MRGLLTSGMSGFAGLSYEDLLREGMMIAGSADSVGAELERLRDELGFGALNLLFCIGDMPHDHVVKSMELFASQVMPAFRARRRLSGFVPRRAGDRRRSGSIRSRALPGQQGGDRAAVRRERRADRLALDGQHARAVACDHGRGARHALEHGDLAERVAGQQLAAELAAGDHLRAAAQQHVVVVVEIALADDRRAGGKLLDAAVLEQARASAPAPSGCEQRRPRRGRSTGSSDAPSPAPPARRAARRDRVPRPPRGSRRGERVELDVGHARARSRRAGRRAAARARRTGCRVAARRPRKPSTSTTSSPPATRYQRSASMSPWRTISSPAAWRSVCSRAATPSSASTRSGSKRRHAAQQLEHVDAGDRAVVDAREAVAGQRDRERQHAAGDEQRAADPGDRQQRRREQAAAALEDELAALHQRRSPARSSRPARAG